MGLVAPRHVSSSQTGLEPMSPALAGRFLTTAPPRKSLIVVLICISLISNVEHFFHVPVGPLYEFFEKMSIQIFCLFLKWDWLFLLFSFIRYWYILDISPLSDIWLANIFLPFGRLSFHFLNDFLCCEGVVLLFYFCFCCFCFWCQIQKNCHHNLCRRAYYVFS